MSNMNSYVYQLLTSYFQKRNFQQIPTDSTQVSMYATFQNACLYLINLIILESDYSFNYKRYEQYRETTRKQFENVQSNKVYLLNLLIVDDPKQLYKVLNKEPDMEKRFIDIHWLVNSETKELLIPKNQPKRLLGLEKTLVEIINSGIESLEDWRKTSTHVYLTRTFVGVNVLLFSLLTLCGSGILVLPEFLQKIYDYLLVKEGKGTFGWYLVSVVVHQNFIHLLYTSLGIYILGSRLEHYFSEFQYVLVYVISAVSGAVFCYFGSQLTGIIEPSVGANGAIYGMIASVLILSKAASRPLAGISDLIVWGIFTVGILYSVVSHDVAAFANIGGFAGGLIVSIPIDIHLLKHQG